MAAGSYRQRHYERYERSYDRDDDDERSYRRERRQHQRATRHKNAHPGGAQSATPAGREASAPAAGGDATAGGCQARAARRSIAAEAAKPTPQRQARNDGRGCLRSAARALLDRIEAQFGPMQLISTCRPGARIAGSGRISKHASGEAIDFNAGRRKGEVVRWLIANHKSGGTMTYAGMSHIHVDVGQHFVALNSGGGR